MGYVYWSRRGEKGRPHFEPAPNDPRCTAMAPPATAASHRGKLRTLEAARGFAALYVVIHHAGLFEGSRLRVLVSFGQEAVMLFFLLSGFVIYYSAFGRGDRISFGEYINRRVRRIWPLFLLALALAYLLLSIGRHALQPISASALVGNLLMLQDNSSLKPGVVVDTFSGNSALWSLSYEWWFYLMFFPVVVLLSRHMLWQKYIVFGASAAGLLLYQVIPNQACLFLAYFCIWWCGVECAREYLEHRRVTWRRQLAPLMMLGCITLLWSFPVVTALAHHQGLRWGVYPVLQLRHAATALALLAAGIVWHRLGFPAFRFTLGPFRVLAPISYALYVLHVPVLAVLASVLHVSAAIRLAVALVLLIPLCYLLEVVLQRRINRVFDRLLPGRERVTAVPSLPGHPAHPGPEWQAQES